MTPAGAPPLRVALLAFDEVEALDLAGPYEVFTTAVRMAERLAPGAAAPFEVYCVARTRQAVRARAGLQVLPDADFADAAPPDVLVVPGGVVDAARRCSDTLAWIARAAARARITAAVCTGAFLLADAGVLRQGGATTHWEDIADLRAQHPGLQVREGVRWVAQPGGRLYTSAGISAGIDLSLHLVERLASRALALRTARQMDYAWSEPPQQPPPAA
ncbi:DJ-1/PfpI family protein [Acidovorax sp. FG27]|uniref:DJ-1/PfpI family protein n=1 Tax=Acidovorax sp. FG27 TaxID=3133652 RepID=UPI0030E87079